MRTTLTIDEDLLTIAKSRAAELDLTLNEVINRTLRGALVDEPRRAAKAVRGRKPVPARKKKVGKKSATKTR